MECIGHTFHPSLSPFISTTHCTNAIGWARVGAWFCSSGCCCFMVCFPWCYRNLVIRNLNSVGSCLWNVVVDLEAVTGASMVIFGSHTIFRILDKCKIPIVQSCKYCTRLYLLDGSSGTSRSQVLSKIKFILNPGSQDKWIWYISSPDFSEVPVLM